MERPTFRMSDLPKLCPQCSRHKIALKVIQDWVDMRNDDRVKQDIYELCHYALKEDDSDNETRQQPAVAGRRRSGCQCS